MQTGFQHPNHNCDRCQSCCPPFSAMLCLQAYDRKLQKHEFDSQDSMLAYVSKHGKGSGDAQLKKHGPTSLLCASILSCVCTNIEVKKANRSITLQSLLLQLNRLFVHESFVWSHFGQLHVRHLLAPGLRPLLVSVLTRVN